MAMIPVVNETNRIQVGSPVPIGGTEQARAASEANEALGKAIFDLGNALDNDKENKQDYRPIAKVFANEYERQMLRNASKIRVDSTMDDRSGDMYTEEVYSSVNQLEADLRTQLPEAARIFYDEYVSNAKVQHVGKFLETGINGNVEKRDATRNQAFAGINELASADPESLPTRFIEIEVMVEEDGDIPVSLKPSETRTRQAAALKSVTDTYREQGRRLSDGRSFDQARATLMQYGKLMDKDALSKELKDINNEQYDSISRSRSDIDWNRKNNDYIETKEQSDAAAKIAGKFRAAKTPYDTLLVEKEASQLVADKKMTFDQYQNAKGLRSSINKTVDDLFESSVINQLVQEQGAISVPGKKSAVEKINAAFKKPGGISPERHSDLIQLANRLRDNGSMSRERYTEMQSYMKVIDTYAQTSITAIGDEQVKREHAARIAATQATFVKSVLNNPNTKVDSLYETIIPQLDSNLSVKGIMKNQVPGLPTIQQVTPGAVERSIPQLKQDVIDANKSGDASRIRRANDALFKAHGRTKNQGGK